MPGDEQSLACVGQNAKFVDNDGGSDVARDCRAHGCSVHGSPTVPAGSPDFRPSSDEGAFFGNPRGCLLDGLGFCLVLSGVLPSVAVAAAAVFGVEAAFDGMGTMVGRVVAAVSLPYAAVFGSHSAFHWGLLLGQNVYRLVLVVPIFALDAVGGGSGGGGQELVEDWNLAALCFYEVDAIRRDGEVGVVGLDDVALAFEIPSGEVEVVAREAHALLDLSQGDCRSPGVGTSAVVEQGDEGQAAIELAVHLVHEVDGGGERNELRRFLFPGQVIVGAARGIGENIVSILEDIELLRVTGFGVVGMESCGEEVIDTMDGFMIGIGADLKKFVIVDVLWHGLSDHPFWIRNQ